MRYKSKGLQERNHPGLDDEENRSSGQTIDKRPSPLTPLSSY